jgi:anti-sigma factor RsiW
MSDCRSIDPLITPYVDDDIDAAGRLRVDAHVQRCPPCRSRVVSERAVRELMHVKRAEIAAATAPDALRARCDALRGQADRAASRARFAPSAWRARVKPLSIAAGVMLVLGGVGLYEATDRSTRVLAAELTADHVKCFGVVNPLVGANADAAMIERAMEEMFGWQMHVPEAAGIGLEFVGARPCLYAKGRAAHLMYRHHGQPVSVFMLPQLTRPGKQNETVEVMGHEAAVWSEGGRTFVLVAREPDADVQRVVSAVQASLH